MALTDVTSSTITVQWGSVPCIHQNGVITGYSVQYEVEGSGNTSLLSVDGADTTETNITGLNPSTNYSISVAAVNDAGPGNYSSHKNQQTEGHKFYKTNMCMNKCILSFRCTVSDG